MFYAIGSMSEDLVVVHYILKYFDMFFEGEPLILLGNITSFLHCHMFIYVSFLFSLVENNFSCDGNLQHHIIFMLSMLIKFHELFSKVGDISSHVHQPFTTKQNIHLIKW
jgi:hypothetical protein